ncbi:MAG: ferrous iron transporter B [Acidobacteriota bacterium]
MRFVLAGQPNSGKSTIFNSVAGYRAATANFPGSSVTFTVSKALILGREVEVIDLPGIYSLTSSQEEVGTAEAFLLEESFDLLINVVDASRLGRSIELTQQLLELERPVVVALNMMDEAARGGMEVNHQELSRQLGVPVVPTVGRRGVGLKELFRVALRNAHVGETPVPLTLDREAEEALEDVGGLLAAGGVDGPVPQRLLAEKLLERDSHIESEIYGRHPELEEKVREVADALQSAHGWSADQVISGSRHAVSHCIEELVVTHHRPKIGWREWTDRLLLHPLTGGPAMVTILGILFFLVFRVGQRLEAPLVAFTDRVAAQLAAAGPPDTLLGTIAAGAFSGLAGGVAIVLPYLLPFPIMSARILESRRDRRITAFLASFIPCSARTIVIFGLVAAFMGPWWALGIYLLNLLIVVLLGNVLARTMKGASPGLILEIPELQVPSLRTLVAKTWLTLKEFIVIAWPLLVASSIVLGLLEWAHSADRVNALLSPLTVGLLGLPSAVGLTLVFGILRKELTLVMLVQALGTTQINAVMTDGQLLTFTLFVVFYIPCVATIAVIAREFGWRDTAVISVFSVVLALVIGVASRFAYSVFV